jgi:purine-binding chemotaxis protein CheW
MFSGDRRVMQTSKEKHLGVFQLGDEDFAVDIGCVREIIRPVEIVKVPNSPDCVQGLIHLREHIIPIIDLSRMLGVPSRAAQDKTKRFLITEIGGRLTGLSVDAVGEVLRVPASGVEPVPETVSTVRTQYLTGIIKPAGRIVLLMDLEKILSPEELKQLIQK